MSNHVEFHHPALERASFSVPVAHQLLEAVESLDADLADLSPFIRGKILEAAAVAEVLHESVGDSVRDD